MNIDSLKCGIVSFEENYQQITNQEKSILAVDNNSESNINSEALSNEIAALATQLSKCINDNVLMSRKSKQCDCA